MSRRWQLLPSMLAAVVVACAGSQTGGSTSTADGSGGGIGGRTGPPYTVTSQVLHDGTTQQIRVWAPVGEGSWPVVFALPGMGGHKSDFDLLGSALASRGLVVFATDYRANGTLDDIAVDVACGYRLITKVAGDYGGDLARPVTGVGYSRGASLMLSGALHREPSGAGAACAKGLPLPDVVVGVNGCYYLWSGRPQPFPVEELDRREAEVVLVSASEDRNCPAWESKKAAAALRAAGFHATLTTIAGANHFTPIFHDVVGGKWVGASSRTAGEQTVRAIVDAVRAAS